LGPAALGSQNWGMHPEPRQQSWHSRGEKSFLPGTCPCKKRIGFYSGPCEGRKSATLGSSLPKAFPLGGRWAGEAGSDEGAIRYPTFPCRKEAIFRLSPQRGFSIAPLGKSIAPSSVTFGDSFPPRGSLRRCYTPATKFFFPQTPLPQNANPNQGTYTGPVIAPLPSRCATQRQNQRVGTSGP
jgi:hypothetical protein